MFDLLTSHSTAISVFMGLLVIGFCFGMAIRGSIAKRKSKGPSNAPFIAKIIFYGLLSLLGIFVLLWGLFAGYDFWGDDFSWNIWHPEEAVDYYSLLCIILDIPFFFSIFFFGISLSSKAGAKEGSRYYSVREGMLGGLTVENRTNSSLGGCLGAIVGLLVSVALFVSFAQLALLIFTAIRLFKLIQNILILRNNLDATPRETSKSRSQPEEEAPSLADMILDSDYYGEIEFTDKNGDDWVCEKLDVLFYGDNAYGLLLPLKVPDRFKDRIPTDRSVPITVKLLSKDDTLITLDPAWPEVQPLDELYKALYL